MTRIGRDHLLPFLVVAYPATFAILQARPYCSPRCGTLSSLDLLAVAAVIATSLLASVLAGPALLTRALGPPGGSDGTFAARLRSPSRPTVVVLLGLYAALVALLGLDVANVAEAVWKPAILPASLLPFAPVWALYAGTFALALAFRIVGVGSSPALTSVVRFVVVVGGFGASAVWQFLLVEGLPGRRR